MCAHTHKCPPPLPARREDINSGAKDAHELYARDRLRRNVQWMSGVVPLAPPTLSEMDKLLEKVHGRRKHLIAPPVYI